jgi:hypothetical protein
MVLVGVATGGELVRRRFAYCWERSIYSAEQARSLRRAIERYEKRDTSGETEVVSQARNKAMAEYQSMARWYERAARAFEHAATHPWVSTPHDPDIYVRGFPDSTYP